MRISDWSSDVCSSDLMDLLVTEQRIALGLRPVVEHKAGNPHAGLVELDGGGRRLDQLVHRRLAALDRPDVELGRILPPADAGLRRHLDLHQHRRSPLARLPKALPPPASGPPTRRGPPR